MGGSRDFYTSYYTNTNEEYTGVCTPAFVRYLEEQIHVHQFIALASVLTFGIPVLRRVFPTIAPVFAAPLEELVARFEEKGPRSYERMCSEVMVSRAVDNFNSYISNVLLSVFMARPETLRSGARVEVREVLECESIEEFAARMAARRVDELAYGGFRSIREYLEDRLGVKVKFDQGQLSAAKEAIAVRNILVHNQGRVNERFLRDTGRTDLGIGDIVPFMGHQALDWSKGLEGVARSIDDGLITKFGAETFLVRHS